VEVKNENMKQNAKTDKVLIHRLKESKTKKAVELLWKEINKKVRVYFLDRTDHTKHSDPFNKGA